MNCEQSRQYLNPLIDNELPIETIAKLMRHFESCLDCQSDWTSLLRVNDGVKEIICRIEVPDGLTDRIRSRVSSSKLRNSQAKPARRVYKVAGIVATAALVVLAIQGVLNNAGRKENLVASDFVQAYQASTDVDSTGPGTDSEVQQYTSKQARLPGWTLVKREQCRLENVPALRLCYTNERKQLLSCYLLKHGLFDATGLKKHSKNGRIFCCGRLGRVSIVYCPNGKGDSILVSSLSERELMFLAMRS